MLLVLGLYFLLLLLLLLLLVVGLYCLLLLLPPLAAICDCCCCHCSLQWSSSIPDGVDCGSPGGTRLAPHSSEVFFLSFLRKTFSHAMLSRLRFSSSLILAYFSRIQRRNQIGNESLYGDHLNFMSPSGYGNRMRMPDNVAVDACCSISRLKPSAESTDKRCRPQEQPTLALPTISVHTILQ